MEPLLYIHTHPYFENDCAYADCDDENDHDDLMEPLTLIHPHTHILSIENDNNADCDDADERDDDEGAGEGDHDDDDQSHISEKSPNFKVTNIRYLQYRKCFYRYDDPNFHLYPKD